MFMLPPLWDEIAAAGQQMSASSDQLVSAMDTVSSVVEENTTATEEMAASSGEASQAIKGLASISEENSAAAEEMTAQVEEVTASAQSLSAMAQALVAQFKLTADAAQVVRPQAVGAVAPVRVAPAKFAPTGPALSRVEGGYGREREELPIAESW